MPGAANIGRAGARFGGAASIRMCRTVRWPPGTRHHAERAGAKSRPPYGWTATTHRHERLRVFGKRARSITAARPGRHRSKTMAVGRCWVTNKSLCDALIIVHDDI